jgi:octaprenyl-diphosphate synthase
MGAYLAASRGKRIRPTLLLLASRMLGYRGDKDVTYAAIFELVHTASLIHDDIVDQALLRRGRASLNARYGSEMAVLMGDYVFTLALNLANREGTGPILTVISETTLDLVRGELLQSHHKYDLTLSMEDYLEILRCKTSQLFSACAQTPALMVEAPEEQRDALAGFGKNMGLAFQIVDDCLDFSSDEATLGKPACNDLKEGKITLPLLLLMERGSTRDRAFLEAVVTSRRFDPDTLREVVDRASRAGTLHAAEEMAADYTRRAQACLQKLPEGDVRDILARLPEIALRRKF